MSEKNGVGGGRHAAACRPPLVASFPPLPALPPSLTSSATAYGDGASAPPRDERRDLRAADMFCFACFFFFLGGAG